MRGDVGALEGVERGTLPFLLSNPSPGGSIDHGLRREYGVVEGTAFGCWYCSRCSHQLREMSRARSLVAVEEKGKGVLKIAVTVPSRDLEGGAECHVYKAM